ncbi:MAG: hypothetical protein IKB86_05470 [Clostridia bacterium]|nr:hypothetical protein [Clostridia bacterium]
MKRIIAIFAVFALILTIFCSCVKGDTNFPKEYVEVKGFYDKWAKSKSYDDAFFGKNELNIEDVAIVQEDVSVSWTSMLAEFDSEYREKGLKYVFADLDSNGINEMLVIIDDYVTAIFTHNGEKAVLLDAYWPRYIVLGIKENKLLVRSSGGASYTAHLLFTIDGTEINLSEELTFEIEDLSADKIEETYYHSVDGEKKTITKDQFYEKIAQLKQEYNKTPQS